VPAVGRILGQLVNTAAKWAEKGDAYQDLALANKEVLIRDVIISVCLGCRDQRMVGSQVPGVRKASSGVQMGEVKRRRL